MAFVVADDRYAASDGVAAVTVEYEELPVLVDPFKAELDGAPVPREDIADQKEGAHGARRHPNHIFTWESGDRAATEAVLAEAEVVAEEMIYYHRTHPCPLETCGCVASMDKVNGKLTVWGTFQAPHAVRTVASLISGIAEHNIRVISPDIGGVVRQQGRCLSRLCLLDRGLDRHRRAGEMGRGPLRQPDGDGICPRLLDDGRISATKDGKITGLHRHTTADHGAFDACADPTKFPALRTS